MMIFVKVSAARIKFGISRNSFYKIENKFGSDVFEVKYYQDNRAFLPSKMFRVDRCSILILTITSWVLEFIQ